jgi:hypothetical protein
VAGCQWLTPIILATQEAEIRKMMVQSQPGQIVCKTLSQKKPFTQKNRAGGVAQGEGPGFKPQYCKKKNIFCVCVCVCVFVCVCVCMCVCV